MPKEIKDPLREGLPSKLYYYAFATQTSRYAIARRIHNITAKGVIPPTDKVSTASKEMLEGAKYGTKYLMEPIKGEGIISDIAPFLDEIETDLKLYDVSLTVDERDELIRFLENGFRGFVLRDYGRIKKGDINAYSELMKVLGSIVFTKLITNNLSVLGAGVFTPHVVKQFEKQFSPQNNPRPELQAVADIELSPELLNKLATLTTDHIMGAVREQLGTLKQMLKD